MSFRSRAGARAGAGTRAWVCTALVGALLGSACDNERQHADARELRVCADPNNLPFSNESGEGFENKIAQVVADEMHAKLRYTWWAQRRGFIRNTLRAELCDVIIGLPTSVELARTTAPYYRSSYVFVWRKDRALDIRSLDDPRLRDLRIGVQIVGDDGANTPPVHALANRGIVRNVRGYSVIGDYRDANPPARVIDAVARGEVDVAIAWGPLAGYFATREPVALAFAPVSPQIDVPFLPMVFDISMAVRREDAALGQELEAILERRRGAIERILDEFGVPRVPRPGVS
jgi:mxaJ protein